MFEEFPKIARLNRECTITEKLDGTNAQVIIVQSLAPEFGAIAHRSLGTAGDISLFAGSRTRLITPNDDNYGFAKWVVAHADELIDGLGVGRHFGEWWGAGIQRKYGLKEKRFSLFNTARWAPASRAQTWLAEGLIQPLADKQAYVPACCHVVPVLYQGLFDTDAVLYCIRRLVNEGSIAAPGFMKPEGVVIYHTAGQHLYKVTVENDESPKSLVQ